MHSHFICFTNFIISQIKFNFAKHQKQNHLLTAFQIWNTTKSFITIYMDHETNTRGTHRTRNTHGIKMEESRVKANIVDLCVNEI